MTPVCSLLEPGSRLASRPGLIGWRESGCNLVGLFAGDRLAREAPQLSLGSSSDSPQPDYPAVLLWCLLVFLLPARW